MKIMNVIRLIEFLLLQLAGALIVWLYSTAKKIRFEMDHPDGMGAAIANYYWDSQWQYWLWAVLITGLAFYCYKQKRGIYAEVNFSLGKITLLMWMGLCFVAMELNYIPVISLGSGAKY